MRKFTAVLNNFNNIMGNNNETFSSKRSGKANVSNLENKLEINFMKICFVAPGSNVHTKRWVNFFAEKGHDVHLITFEPVEDGYSKSVKIYNLIRILPNLWLILRYINGIIWSFQAWWLIRSIEPDIINAHYITLNGYLCVFNRFHPLVLTAWGSDIWIDPKKNFLLKILTKYTLKKADCITCDGDNIKEEIARLGDSHNKIKIICFGTDIKKFYPNKKNKELKRALEINNSPIVISLRNLKPIYDVGSLIKAIPLILKEVPEAKFIVAGRGSQEAELKQLAKSLGVSDSIRFAGFISNDELPQYIALADVYVSTSLSDGGIAASTAEAMACGLPVVITDFGDNRKWVEDGLNGFIVPLKDPEALAEKIIYLLKNEDIRKEFGERNRKIIEERNNYYKEMEKMENIYTELIERYKT